MKTIIETAADAGRFTTLLSALGTAGLTEGLRGSTAYTVFAPTDEAFKRLAPGAMDALLKDARKLKDVLNYHVVPGAIAAKDIRAGNVTTVEGTQLTVTVQGNQVLVNGAKVVQADIQASNGIIHVIDAVIMPAGVRLAAAA